MGDRVDIDTSGLDRVLRQLRHNVDPIAQRACTDTAQRVADTTSQNVPRRSGRLAGSVRVERQDDGARVEMGAPYAGWIEYGGTRGRAYVGEGRYLGPAARGADRDIARQAERELERGAHTW